MCEKKYFSLTLDMSISDMSFRHIKITKQRFDNDHSPDWRSRDALQFFSFKSSCIYRKQHAACRYHYCVVTIIFGFFILRENAGGCRIVEWPRLNSAWENECLMIGFSAAANQTSKSISGETSS